MAAPIEIPAPVLRPSQVIAEALVERQGPRQIVSRASTLGLNRPLTQAILAACCSTATHPIPSARRRAIATT